MSRRHRCMGCCRCMSRRHRCMGCCRCMSRRHRCMGCCRRVGRRLRRVGSALSGIRKTMCGGGTVDTFMRHHRCRVLRHPDQAEDQGKGAQDHQRQRTSLMFLYQNPSLLNSSDVVVCIGSEGRRVHGSQTAHAVVAPAASTLGLGMNAHGYSRCEIVRPAGR